MGRKVQKTLRINSIFIDFLNPLGFFKVRAKGIKTSGDNKNSCIMADKNHVGGKH